MTVPKPSVDQLLNCMEFVYVLDFCAASEATDEVARRRYLHAGPPLDPRDATGPMRGALIAGLLYEGEATSSHDAEQIIDRGEVDLLPCHQAGGVGALAGIVTPNVPVVRVESNSGRRAFAPINEGLGKATRFGNYDQETVRRLGWLKEVFAPALSRAVAACEPIDIVELQAEGLRRGDECHNRNVASSAQLLMILATAIVETATPLARRRKFCGSSRAIGSSFFAFRWPPVSASPI